MNKVGFLIFWRQRWSCRCIIFRQMRTSVTKTTQRSIFALLGNLHSDNRSQIWMYLIFCTLAARRGTLLPCFSSFWVIFALYAEERREIWWPNLKTCGWLQDFEIWCGNTKNSFPYCFFIVLFRSEFGDVWCDLQHGSMAASSFFQTLAWLGRPKLRPVREKVLSLFFSTSRVPSSRPHELRT